MFTPTYPRISGQRIPAALRKKPERRVGKMSVYYDHSVKCVPSFEDNKNVRVVDAYSINS